MMVGVVIEWGVLDDGEKSNGTVIMVIGSVERECEDLLFSSSEVGWASC